MSVDGISLRDAMNQQSDEAYAQRVNSYSARGAQLDYEAVMVAAAIINTPISVLFADEFISNPGARNRLYSGVRSDQPSDYCTQDYSRLHVIAKHSLRTRRVRPECSRVQTD